ncbi:MAG: hypothetical protein A2898_02410 [Candidatus Kerfeldbacteria bacterium RIFCSPLOWO2_01_FULL_48_11]|uniref:ZIP family metal transporter n=1 Tax=Candidatus Kerfeldbacteria bacterium RIFCSPLOWO2_01_FULL_48_11 TaxID=1798543 RepID=A0A1G2B1S7_9BACT|nr:MAG: hypothetical protein UY34_C0021G0004 [Parcubacteria group bacterium GW2011_GWA2_48_9]KKW14073.1 MAG: hypothetical protein UY52_C0033G0006 [Parcubacteria group bacterium GW2011_GWC2_49_9]OGY83108.1 MAG: hypothetical protein A2898_02410 [Candidatus Kerfeldbacteria bacterium RIFCSPLOWO2_01_FULL_48_11]HCM67685.1 ZIP family metal transporter [Candidatus Kerfeldbacteria bacterium]
MIDIWLYTIGSVFVISLVSLVGVLALAVNLEKLRKVLHFLVSFAAGSLLGGAFLHLLPEAVENSESMLRTMYMILAGIILFFTLEKILFWRHCHIPTSEQHPHPVAVNNIIGDGFHNILDGMIIAGAYLVNIPLGITTTIAVLLHEIPQEIGDFSIMIHAGMKKRHAIFFNYLSASLAFLGAVIVLTIGGQLEILKQLLVPFTIGGFLYIAAADLLPELKEEVRLGRSVIQLLIFMLGIAVMALMLSLE